MSALLGVTVSTGFVSSCLVRLDAALTTAGFVSSCLVRLDAALTTAGFEDALAASRRRDCGPCACAAG
jgi:hypothetical protein